MVLELTLEDAIASALERNFTIARNAIGPRIAEQNIRSAEGIFDPVVEGSYNFSSTQFPGFEVESENASVSTQVGSLLPWGTEWTFGVNANDRTTPLDTLTRDALDTVDTFVGVTVSQPLLRDFGLKANRAGVRIARQNLEVAEATFEAAVMDTVVDTVAAFQRLLSARENLRIAIQNRDLALRLLKDNRKRVETGAMAPLDIVQAQSEAALREVSVLNAEALVTFSTNSLKGLIWNDANSVADIDLRLVPPDDPEEIVPDIASDWNHAQLRRPEMVAAQAGRAISEIEVNRFRRNQLPELDLLAAVGRSGRAKTLADSFDDTFSDSGRDEWSVGLVMRVPLFNRTRSANYQRALLLRNDADLEVAQLEQSIRLELENAADQVRRDWLRIEAARTARELAQKSLEAEEKKLQAGTSSTFVVLRLQGDLALAESRETNALADYATSVAAYHRVTGRILDAYRIRIAD